MEQTLSSPSPERLRTWRLFFESALALIDVLDSELEQAAGIPMRWYDVLVHLEESPEGIRDERARGTDPLQQERLHPRHRPDGGGGARPRVRPENDRRTILIVLTEKGTETMDAPAATTETESSGTSRSTSPTRTSRRSLARSRRSAPTPARSAPAASG